MMGPEDKKFIQEEIRRQMNIILHGETDNTDGSKFTEDINALFPGQSVISARPVVHPFGFMSRAIKGTISVVARVGDHIGNRMVIGHRDANRPTDLNEGESAIYSAAGYQIRILKDKIQLGKGGDWETAVVGETLVDLLSSLIQELVLHSHPAPGAAPVDAANFTQLKTNYLDNGKILGKDGGRF